MESEEKKVSAFGSDFMWGASTSSHQVEGGTYNQWTVWELENAARLAKEATHRVLPSSSVYSKFSQLPNWDNIKEQVTKPENYISGEGVDHFNRYKEDLDIVKQLNLNAFRFSIEWSRIEPEEGKWDEEAIEHYKTYIKEIKKRGLEPVLNLWHWTNPVWFEERGGFLKRHNIKYFLRFAATVMEEFGKEVKIVIILNEPNVYSWFSFKEGGWPAPKHSWLSFARGYINLIVTHRHAYRYLKEEYPYIKFSSVPQFANNVPKDPKNYMHRIAAWGANFGNNWFWLLAIRKHFDFIGFNNYFKNYIDSFNLARFANPKKPVNDMGWYMEPAAVGEIIRACHKKYPKYDIIITENGIPDADDSHRKWWISETVQAMEECIKDGIPLKGYFHWSLLDNFEWAEGWWPKFGLVKVDREHNMKRNIRPSAKWFAERLSKIR